MLRWFPALRHYKQYSVHRLLHPSLSPRVNKRVRSSWKCNGRVKGLTAARPARGRGRAHSRGRCVTVPIAPHADPRDVLPHLSSSKYFLLVVPFAVFFKARSEMHLVRRKANLVGRRPHRTEQVRGHHLHVVSGTFCHTSVFMCV